MPQPRWLLAGAVMAVVAVGLLVATLGRGDPAGATAASPSSSAPIAEATSTPTPTNAGQTVTAIADASAATTPDPAPSSAPATAAPATKPARASGPPVLAWAEFLSHLNEDRSTVDGLNRALTTAAEAQDADAVRKASVDILDFVDAERDWLREHPPADCYAAAHGAAAAMLDAYGTAAERFIDWTTTGGGLGGLPALGVAVDAADTARTAFLTFVTVLEGTTCPT